MKSIKAPTVILPKYLQDNGPETRYAAQMYFLNELNKWTFEYKNKVIRSRARYIEKVTKINEANNP